MPNEHAPEPVAHPSSARAREPTAVAPPSRPGDRPPHCRHLRRGGRCRPSRADAGRSRPAASPNAAAGPTDDGVDDFGLVREAWDLLHEKYVGRDTLDDRELAYGAIDGLADAVGTPATPTTPGGRTSRNDALSGSYVGIGVQLDTTDNDEPRVVTVFHDSPADKAGLRTGDVILEVDGVPAAGSSLDDVVERIRGEAGTAVELTVRRGRHAEDPEDRARRGRDRRRVVDDGPGHDHRPPPDRAVLERRRRGRPEGAPELRKEGADRLVLDLRGNPGGYVGEAVGTASQFLSSGTVYVERNAEGEEKATPVSPDGVWTDLPLIVLVDEGSASASEIVSGALQDNDCAEVVGATTFGTGTVLGEYALEDGSALRIGTVEWLTPDGRRIWHEGIEPDVAVARATEALPTLPSDGADLAPARGGVHRGRAARSALELIEAD